MSGIVIDLRVPRREFSLDVALRAHGTVAVGGPSGSGKTTLLRSVAGLETGASGFIAVGQETWLDGERGLLAEQRCVGMLAQDAGLFPHLTAAQNVEFPLRAERSTRRARRTRALELLSALGIDELAEAAVQNLSGGQRRRVGLARALAAERSVYLLDEPFAGLDARSADAALELIDRRARESGAPTLIAGHDHTRLRALADRAIVLARGRMLMAEGVRPAGSVARERAAAPARSPRSTVHTHSDCRGDSR